VAILAQN